MFKNLGFKWMMSCLRILGNFIASDERTCSELVTKHQMLDTLQKVMAIGSKQHKKEALWVLSNIAANSEADSIAVVNS